MPSYSSFSAEDLIRACVGPESETAWVEFIRRFRPLIAKVALRTARRWEEPPRQLLDDLIQDTYLRLCADNCQLLERFRERHANAIFGFLKVVAASVVHDHYKAERALRRDINQTDVLSDGPGMDPPASGEGSFDAVEKRVRLREIDEALVKLFQGKHLARNRAIFWLHYRDGMTASAIASISWIGLDTKGVESTLRRMTHMIQSHIGADK